MAWFFGDGFDTYQQLSDAYSSGTYWDSGNNAFMELASTARFTGSRAIVSNNASTSTAALAKSSGSNDAVHHFNIAYYQSSTQALTGTTKEFMVALYDGATAQCTVGFRSDGAILLYFGGPTSTTVLATYSSAITATNTWYEFEIEVVINNTTGSFKVRKNGNTSDDSSTTGLNNRVSANNYANKIQLHNGGAGGGVHFVDDFLWRSDTSSVAWAGDVRCNTRLPASDAAATWTRSGSTVPVTPYVQGTTTTITSGTARYSPFTAACSGTIGTLIVSLALGFTGNYKCTLFNDTGSGAPGTVLGSATAITNPTSGNNTFTFGSPPTVVQGTKYWLGLDSDTTTASALNVATNNFVGAYGNSGVSSNTSYASFPTASPTVATSGISCLIFTVNITPTTAANANLVADANGPDGAGGYIYDSTPGDTDLYALQAISGTPNSILAVTTRMLAQKSDAGTRTAALVLKSGTTTSVGSAVALNTSFAYIFRTDVTDPNTGSAWTATAVNNLQAGMKVIA